ncbi:MAG: protease-like activity factor CPAF [Elusimicrobia bacterium]|nr:protease-like activity factor CPAF [Elusimicrobiota bacterium]
MTRRDQRRTTMRQAQTLLLSAIGLMAAGIGPAPVSGQSVSVVGRVDGQVRPVPGAYGGVGLPVPGGSMSNPLSIAPLGLKSSLPDLQKISLAAPTAANALPEGGRDARPPAWTAPALDASLIPALPAPVGALAAPMAAVPSLARPSVAAAPRTAPPAQAAPQAPGQEQGGVARAVAEMKQEVGRILEAAGPMDRQAAEDSHGAADGAFRALTRERVEASGILAEPAEDLAASALPSSQPNLTQQKMIATLYKIASIFSEQYAPVEWKKDRFQLDLKAEFEKVKRVILAEPNIGTRRFQSLLADFVAAMRDYHVSIGFYSTEKAKLPLLVMGAEGKYYIAYINRSLLPKESFPFREGDEIVEFGGRPTADAVAELARARAGNTTETDLRLAEIFLTNRSRSMGNDVPQGPVTLKIKTRSGAVSEAQLTWLYSPERIPVDVPVRDAGLDLPAPGTGRQSGQAWGDEGGGSSPASRLKGIVNRLFTWAAHPLDAVFAQMRKESVDNPFILGAKKSYVPTLGPVVWQAKADNPFHAYIYTDQKGRKVGYVRIPHYGGGDEEAQAFGRLMGKFQRETEGLVIDQVNNPGGSLFYLYALASHLTDKPLASPKHRILIDESDAAWALETLEKLQDPVKGELAMEEMEEDDEWTGVPVDEGFVDLMIKFARFILSELGAGRRLTGPTHLWGVDDIQPAPAKLRFTKPVLLLTNALDFSGGDFFPAILQDNKRVTILGVRTSGAGGAVKPFSVPNQFGVEQVNATWTIAQRVDGKPIENLGVQPDVKYDLTGRDLKTGFAPYRRAIRKAMDKLLPEPPKPPTEAAPAPKP